MPSPAILCFKDGDCEPGARALTQPPSENVSAFQTCDRKMESTHLQPRTQGFSLKKGGAGARPGTSFTFLYSDYCSQKPNIGRRVETK